MYVYFVRHGETVLNRGNIHQTPHTPLSVKGWEQARTVAEYIRPMHPEVILSSSYTRAMETARVIGQTLKLTPQSSTLYREIDRPTSLSGTSILGRRTFWYVLLSVWHRKDPEWRFEDAENFTDIYTRVRKTMEHIEELGEKHQSVVVVSHNIYINLLIAYMCHDRILAVRDLLPSFLNIKKMQNCGVVAIRRRNVRNACGCTWEVVK